MKSRDTTTSYCHSAGSYRPRLKYLHNIWKNYEQEIRSQHKHISAGPHLVGDFIGFCAAGASCHLRRNPLFQPALHHLAAGFTAVHGGRNPDFRNLPRGSASFHAEECQQNHCQHLMQGLVFPYSVAGGDFPLFRGTRFQLFLDTPAPGPDAFLHTPSPDASAHHQRL